MKSSKDAPSAPDPNEGAATSAGIELRSIDWVPHSERHGKIWHVGAVWFAAGAQLTTFATGVVAMTLGGNLIWTIIALIAGTLVGTFFAAFHSSQGPQLGLPQLIQSRPQFGRLGSALLILPCALLSYAGYNAFNQLLVADALENVAPIPKGIWLQLVAVLAFVVALWGYNLIHRVQRFLTVSFIILFGLYTVGLIFTIGLPTGSFDLGGFRAAPFLGAFGLAMSYNLGWALYVSDYSRYLPASVGVRASFQWTYWGMAISAIWLTALGATVAWPVVAGGGDPGVIDQLRTTGDALFSGWGLIVVLGTVPTLVMILAMNMYGGALVLITMADSFRPLRPRLRHRVVGILLVTIVGSAGATMINGNAQFASHYNQLLVIILYLLAPWTAINLVDFFFVRRGRYALKEFFNPSGIYSGFAWRGVTSYIVAILVSVPFWAVGGLYIGPVATLIGGADIAPFVGIVVGAVLYLILCRSLDLASERQIEERDGLLTGAALAELSSTSGAEAPKSAISES